MNNRGHTKSDLHGLKKQASILVVDDDEGIRITLNAMLRRHHKVTCVSSGEQALKVIASSTFDVMLLDINLPKLGGLDVLEQVRRTYEDMEVIVFSIVQDTPTIVKAMKLGAHDYIQKGFDLDDLLAKVEKVLENKRIRNQIRLAEHQAENNAKNDIVVGRSPHMRDILDLVYRVARLPATVLIHGETGTGKEVLARKIHQESDRADCPFIGVNLAAIPSGLLESTLFGHERGSFTGAEKQRIGKFELADSGTLFLDEVGELRIDLQTKLLRVIQEREIERVGSNKIIKIHARIIAATNKDLLAEIRDGRFREDLYYRLNVVPIRIPPLRERVEDLSILISHFLSKYNDLYKKKIKKFSSEATEFLSQYHWPGNIRELENLVERMVATCLGDVVREVDIPIEFSYSQFTNKKNEEDTDQLKRACENFEKRFLVSALERYHWNGRETATNLGVAYSTLKYRFTKYGIMLKDWRERS